MPKYPESFAQPWIPPTERLVEYSGVNLKYPFAGVSLNGYRQTEAMAWVKPVDVNGSAPVEYLVLRAREPGRRRINWRIILCDRPEGERLFQGGTINTDELQRWRERRVAVERAPGRGVWLTHYCPPPRLSLADRALPVSPMTEVTITPQGEIGFAVPKGVSLLVEANWSNVRLLSQPSQIAETTAHAQTTSFP